MTDCNHNIDPLKLIREGTSQDQRPFEALHPAYAPVNEMTPAHSMVFAQAYAAYLRYVDVNDVPVDDWKQFFASDVSVILAIISTEDVENYRNRILDSFRFLNNLANTAGPSQLAEHLSYLFSCIATMARQLDWLKENLPAELGLKTTLQNLIRNQLSSGLGRLIAYYDAGRTQSLDFIDEDAVPVDLTILGSKVVHFKDIMSTPFSADWHVGSPDWTTHVATLISDVYFNEALFDDPSSGANFYTRVRYAANYNLFTSVFDEFLKVYSRVVAEAKKSLESTLTNWDRHEPHYTLFLAFLRLFEYARAEMNTLTGRHLDFYYKEILQLKEKPAQPGHAHLLVELAKHAASHQVKEDTYFQAGKDDLGKDVFFKNDNDFIANQAKVAALKTIYRHDTEPVRGDAVHTGRLFASPVANSEDGNGAELINANKSWHPFFNKVYDNGVLQQIKMPLAEVGFAIASHHLLMAEGRREVTIDFSLDGNGGSPGIERKHTVACLFSYEKGWIEIEPISFKVTNENKLQLKVIVEGTFPSITPYKPKIHGYQLDTKHPVLLVKLNQANGGFIYPVLQNIVIKHLTVEVKVTGLRTLAVSNDFGAIDTSKPFQPFGPSPITNNVLIIGSKEVFQKRLASLAVNVKWQNLPQPYPPGKSVNLRVDFLKGGEWFSPAMTGLSIHSETIPITNALPLSVVDALDLTDELPYDTGSLHGFVRLRLTNDFGQSSFEKDLIAYIKSASAGTKPVFPLGPFISEINLDYSSRQIISLNNGGKEVFDNRAANFFHILPFGISEQHPYLKNKTAEPIAPTNSPIYTGVTPMVNSVSDNFAFGSQNTTSSPIPQKTSFSDADIHLLPPMRHISMDGANQLGESVMHESEFYIGLTGLKPPQNLSLLFQVADGTADPLSQKPKPHLHWSYLHDNNWKAFDKDAVEDQTGELIQSGIVTLAMPREISDNNTLLPPGMHWIRIAVEKESDTVCRIISVAAQALRATFIDQQNDPAFSVRTVEAGKIAKLQHPDSAVKKIIQPFASFGGRGKESSDTYYTRVSERLRHKERAIALWDYERLILEAFPQIYKVKCLNHTQYEPNQQGDGIYRELAAGHVTIVTIPNQLKQNLKDPLRPYTSLGLLQEIDAFIKDRLTCFAKLHVKNPQFEEIQVAFQVRFHIGFDETFYTNQLKRDITRFLSPWAYPNGGRPSFGGKIYKSVLINFIEERPYVDYVVDFSLYHIVGGVSNTIDRNDVEGSTAVSILVSVPEEKHQIKPIGIATPLSQSAGDPCPCQT